MQEKIQKSKRKKQLSLGLTRRKITENNICQNIMNFNQPAPLHSFRDMELSSEYHTQVSPHRFMQQSNMLPFMNL